MRKTCTVCVAVIIGVLVVVTYALMSSQWLPKSPETAHPATGQPFVLSLGESKMIGNLQLKFAETTYPPEGSDAISLGAEFPDPPGTYHAELEMEEEGDRHWFFLNELEAIHHFHDYEIHFISAGGDTVTLRIDAAPRNVPVSEAEAVRKALEVARARGKLLPGMSPLSMTRTLDGLTWIIGMTFGLDDGLAVMVSADTGEIFNVSEDSCC